MGKLLENFEPSTSTELMLIGKIRQLEYQLELIAYEKGINLAYENFDPLKINQIDMIPRLTLPYTARVRCAVNARGSLEILTETHFKDNPKCFGRQYFVSPEPQTPYQAEKYVNHLHELQMREVAEWLSNQ